MHLIYTLKQKKAGLEVKALFWIIQLVALAIMIGVGLVLDEKETDNGFDYRMYIDSLMCLGIIPLIIIAGVTYYKLHKALNFGELKD